MTRGGDTNSNGGTDVVVATPPIRRSSSKKIRRLSHDTSPAILRSISKEGEATTMDYRSMYTQSRFDSSRMFDDDEDMLASRSRHGAAGAVNGRRSSTGSLNAFLASGGSRQPISSSSDHQKASRRRSSTTDDDSLRSLQDWSQQKSLASSSGRLPSSRHSGLSHCSSDGGGAGCGPPNAAALDSSLHNNTPSRRGVRRTFSDASSVAGASTSSRRSNLRRASSRDTLPDLRSAELISRGASQDLMDRMAERYNTERIDADSTSQQTYITSLIEDIRWAFRELGYTMDFKQLESWAIFVHEVLTRDSRSVHGLSQVFVISAGAWPIQLLAAVFRNIIMHYVDGDIHEKAEELIKGVIMDDFVLNPNLSDPRERLIASIFGFKPGECLKAHEGQRRGLDMFLSCICASRLFESMLSMKHTAEFASCMEASIPFRKADTPEGPTPLDKLFENLCSCNLEFYLGMDEEELVETVQLASDLRNRTMGNMLTDSPAEFLHSAWRRLAEENEALRKGNLFTLTEYYTAIQSLVNFMEGIEGDAVFCSFRGVPAPDEEHDHLDYLEYNLSIAHSYIRSRLLSVAVVVAFATLTGGDAPKSFFFGDLTTGKDRNAVRLGDTLPYLRTYERDKQNVLHLRQHYNRVTYDLLLGHKMHDTTFDRRQAPLAAYLYRQLGDERVVKLANEQCMVALTKETSWKLLQSFSYSTAVKVGMEVGRVTVARKRRIERVLEELKQQAGTPTGS